MSKVDEMITVVPRSTLFNEEKINLMVSWIKIQ